jgi:hypothetical protein
MHGNLRRFMPAGADRTALEDLLDGFEPVAAGWTGSLSG